MRTKTAAEKAVKIKEFKDAGFTNEDAEFFYELSLAENFEEGARRGAELKAAEKNS